MGVFDVYGNSLLTPAFVNVRDFGATGDGTTDDSSAIQSALSSIRITGGMIYFPAGIYLIKTAVMFYSNQTLIFDGATLKQGAAIDNLLRSYSESTWTGYDGVHDVVIYGGTFDGGTYTENNSLLAFCHAKNIIVDKCTFKNGYGTWHDIEVNSSYNVKILNCDLEGSRRTGTNSEMIQVDGAGSSSYYPWSGTAIDSTVSKYIEIAGCIFHDSSYSPGVGNHSDMAHKFISIHDCVFVGLTSSRGSIIFTSSVTDVDIYNNTFDGCSSGVASSGASYYIRGNRFTSVTSPIAGSTSVVHANMINGIYTA